MGLLVSSTGSSNTYTYHKLLGKESDIKSLSDDINDFNNRYRIASSAPSSSLDDGDLWFDTTNNKMKVYNASGTSWDDVAAPGNFFINTLSSSSGSGGGSATFNGTATRFTLSSPPAQGAQQCIVSVNGVIQKPNSGTSPSEGFAVDGNDIIFAAAPATSSPFFIITIGNSVNIGTPSDNTVSTVKIQNQAVNNDKVSNSAAIAGTKISPDFGSQNIVTTGELTVDTNTLKVDATNNRVGVGTASPGRTLDVDGIIRSDGTSGALVLGGNSSTPSEGAAIHRPAADTLAFVTDSTEKLRIDSSGNVGIADTSPSCKLAITDLAEHTAYASVTPSVTACMLQLYNNPPNETDNDHATMQFGVNGGSHNRVASISAVAESAGNRKLALTFCTDEAGSRTEKLRITGDGNVGIGTTSPSNLLHVAGTLECSNIKILGTNSFESSANVLEGQGTNGVRLRSALSGETVPSFSNKDDPNTGIFLPGSDVIGFTTGGTERARITADGSVGINTDVNGSGGLVQIRNNHAYQSGTTDLLTSASKAALRVRTSSDSSKSLYIGGIDETANPYLQVGNLHTASGGATAAYDLHLQPYGGGVELYYGGNLSYFTQSNGGAVQSNSTTVSTRYQTSEGTTRGYVYADANDNIGFLTNGGSWSFRLESDKDYAFYGNNISDRDLKDNITTVTGTSLDKITKLVPKTYNWKNLDGKTPTDKTFTGFIAQEVKEHLPNLVTGTDGQKNMAVDYNGILAHAVKAIQELSAEVETLKTKVAALEAK